MRKRLTETVRLVLDEYPGSQRALAREAGLNHATLIHIRNGDHEATPRVALGLASAFRRCCERCKEAEALLSDALGD